MRTRAVAAGSIIVTSLVIGLAGCSGGSGPIGLPGAGDSTSQGDKTSGSSSEGSTPRSPHDSNTASSSNTTTGSGTPTTPPSASTPPADTAAPPTKPPSSGTTAPRPECVAFANHQCACNGSNASATCNADLAKGCEDGVQLCASQLGWYTCVTSHACGTSACPMPSGC